MDPISAVSVAAGAVQFIDVGVRALLGTIRLLQDLKETPKQIKELFRDLDKSVIRILHTRNLLQQPNPVLAQKLNAQRLSSLRLAVSDAYDATAELQLCLLPLQTSVNDPKLKKFWSAVVSVKKAKEIEQKIQRIHRLHNEYTPELQLVGLEMQVEQLDSISRANLSIEATGTEMTDGFANLTTLGEASLAGITTLGNRLDQFGQDAASSSRQILESTKTIHNTFTQHNVTVTKQLNSIELHNSKINQSTSRIESGVHVLQEHVQTLQHDTHSNSEQSRLIMEQVVQSDGADTRADITSLRNEIMLILTTTDARWSEENLNAVVRLGEGDKNELSRRVRRGLMSSPSALRDSCQAFVNTQQATQPRKVDHHTERALYRCSCKKSVSRTWIRKGIFRFESESIQNHKPTCPAFKSSVRSWNYTFATRIFPFLHKTIELSLGATFQGGGFAMAPPLRVYGVVKRSESPIFQLFGQFAHRCGTKAKYREGDIACHSGHYDIKLDADAIERHAHSLIGDLQRIIESGRGSIADKDEYGNTVLHELVYLLDILGPYHRYVLQELRQIIGFLLSQGVDRFGTATLSLSSEEFESYTIGPWTIYGAYFTAQKAMAVVMTLKPASYINTNLVQILDECMALTEQEFTRMPTTFVKRRCAEFLNRFPQLLEAFGIPEIVSTVTRNSDAETLAALAREDMKSVCQSGLCDTVVCPLELAIGYPQSIKALLQAGANPLHAVQLAIRQNDEFSLRTLLAPDTPLFTDFHENAVLLAASCHHSEMQSYVIDELYRRRTELLDLALANTNAAERLELRLGSGSPIDAGAIRAYMFLQRKGVEVPDALYPGPESIYHVLACMIHTVDMKFLDKLYSRGFRNVDEHNSSGETPLQVSIDKSWDSLDNVSEQIFWFLSKGASPTFRSTHRIPHAIHAIAKIYGLLGCCREQQLQREVPWPKDTLAMILDVSDVARTDDCNCHCSSLGCQPAVHFESCRFRSAWHNDYKCCHWRSRLFLDHQISHWVGVCHLRETQRLHIYVDSCQLEVFTRLGMTHTCCSIAYDDRLFGYKRTRPDEVTCKEVHEEEAELGEQLELIMTAFRNFWRKKTASDIVSFGQWWAILDTILPDIVPWQRCFGWECGPRHIGMAIRRRYCGEHGTDDAYDGCEATDIPTNQIVADDYSERLDNSSNLDNVDDDDGELDIFRRSVDCSQFRKARASREFRLPEEYAGLDFVEVIRLHFAEYLRDDDAERSNDENSRSDDEWVTTRCEQTEGRERCHSSLLESIKEQPDSLFANYRLGQSRGQGRRNSY